MANAQEIQKLLQSLGGDQYAQTLYNSAQSAGKIAGQNAMEQLNSNGILNSTVTTDRVAQANNGAMNDYYGKILSYKNQKDQEAESTRRWNADLAEKIREFNANLGMQRDNMSKQEPNYGSTANTKAKADQYYNSVLGTRASANDARAQLYRDYGNLQKIMSETDIADLNRRLQGYGSDGSLDPFGGGTKQWNQNKTIKNPLSNYWNQYNVNWKYQQ